MMKGNSMICGVVYGKKSYTENKLINKSIILKATTGYRRLYLCDRFFEQKMAENEDKTTHRLEDNGYYSSISLVSVIQILASTI